MTTTGEEASKWGSMRGCPTKVTAICRELALCSTTQGKHWVNQVLFCWTSWNLEYADVHCESIKRGCLVQQCFPNLFDHRNLFFFFCREIGALHSLKLSFTPRAH